jgi:hypothetical protein
MSADKLSKIFGEPSECHFNSSAGQTAVCSPKHAVDKMVSFLKKEGKAVEHTDPLKVVSHMKDLLDCNSESCIYKHDKFKNFIGRAGVEDFLDKFFKPAGPATNFGLLSNFNIDDVIDQLELSYKHRHFLHIPFQMRDFEKIGTQLATVDLAEKFRSGYKTFGVVLNTDWSTGNGIHWFCLFGEKYDDHIDLEYFNSSGKEPLPEVQAWLNKTKHHLTRELKMPVNIRCSTGIEYQYDQHSCGVYCVTYIWCRLNEVPFSWFKSENFNDSVMHKMRKNLFRWEV